MELECLTGPEGLQLINLSIRIDKECDLECDLSLKNKNILFFFSHNGRVKTSFHLEVLTAVQMY